MIYFIKVIFNIAVFYSLYKLFLQRSVYFSTNRFYLLGSTFLAFIIPLFDFPFMGSGMFGSYVLAQLNIDPSSEIQRAGSYDWTILLRASYFIFLLLFVSQLFWRIYRLTNIKKATVSMGHFQVHFIHEHQQAYSFFRHIYIPASQYHVSSPVLKHEMLHAQQLHSLDNLIFEGIKGILCFCPPVILMHRELKQVHEYLADREVCRETNSAVYCELLLAQSLNYSLPSFVPSFYQPKLKNRIMMIRNQNRSSFPVWKYLLILPAFVLCTFFTSNISNAIGRPQYKARVLQDKPEVMPEYKGGMEAMMKFIQTNLQYPPAARESKIEGKVVIEFTVTEEGILKDASIKKTSGNTEMDAEAMRVIKQLQHWEPARKNGRKVSCSLVIPVQFKLS